MSTSSNWLIFGMVVQDSTIRRLTVRRNGESFSRRMGPHLEKSIISAGDAEERGDDTVSPDGLTG